MSWKAMALSGWGRCTPAPCLAARPERARELDACLHPPGGRKLLARGCGRSYGDAAMLRDGAVVLTERLDRILAFDPDTGVVVAEAGVTFRDLLDVFLPRGWIAPTSPGTAFVTLGGAVANDVHGKNHHHAGSFGDHVLWLDMLLADGSHVRTSPAERPELFAATIGGIGLTGIITAVCFTLVPARSNAVVVHSSRMPDLDAFLAGFAANAHASWSVGWIDALAGGAALGRGILETAEPAPHDLPPAPVRSRRMPVDLPGCALNPVSVRAFNALYRRRVPSKGRVATLPLGRMLYPLDAIQEWNRMYGKAGFYQFQAVLSAETAPVGLRQMLERVAATGSASFLAVLKATGPQGRGMLSFTRPGVSLALDFPARLGTAELLGDLERVVLDHDGRIYLAKDRTLSASGFRSMYPRLDEFLAVRDMVDPERRFTSDMARRLMGS
jgi:decaprenylphospho-beta-D-ribofuranose 2-oxidase